MNNTCVLLQLFKYLYKKIYLKRKVVQLAGNCTKTRTCWHGNNVGWIRGNLVLLLLDEAGAALLGGGAELEKGFGPIRLQTGEESAVTIVARREELRAPLGSCLQGPPWVTHSRSTNVHCFAWEKFPYIDNQWNAATVVSPRALFTSGLFPVADRRGNNWFNLQTETLTLNIKNTIIS